MSDFLPTLPTASPAAPPRLTLRRLLLMMVLLAALPMLVVEWRSYQQDVAEHEQRAGERLESAARLLAANQGKAVQGVEQLLSSLALSPKFTTEEDRLQCQTQIQAVLDQFHSTYVSLGLTDAQGYLACRSGEAALKIYQGNLPYFQQVLSQRRMVISLVQQAAHGTPTLLMAQAVPGSNAARGVVFAGLDLHSLAQELRDLGVSVPGQRLQVFSADGQELANSDAGGSGVGQNQADDALMNAARQHDGDWKPWTSSVGVKSLRAVQAVQLHDQMALVVVASMPVDTIHAPLLQSAGQRMIWLVVVALVVAALVWWQGQWHMVQPMQRLVQALARIEQGDYSAASPTEPTRLLELAQVQQSLSSLVQTLERQRQERDQGLEALREAHERLEQRVAQRTQALELSNQELEAFAYSVSHDLRNPLGAVAMFTQLLSAQLGEDQDEVTHHCLQRILQGVRGMENLIDDLMVLSQVTRRPLQLEMVNLSALARDRLAELREQAPQRQIEVTVEEGLQAQGDAHLLKQLMVNLIDNAWKFTGRTAQPWIHIGQRPGEAGTSSVYFVEDNGAGFDMQFAHRLFLPFERLHGDQEFPGTGVGLAIVQRVVRRHGGHVSAQAQVQLGARFEFTLNALESV